MALAGMEARPGEIPRTSDPAWFGFDNTQDTYWPGSFDGRQEAGELDAPAMSRIDRGVAAAAAAVAPAGIAAMPSLPEAAAPQAFPPPGLPPGSNVGPETVAAFPGSMTTAHASHPPPIATSATTWSNSSEMPSADQASSAQARPVGVPTEIHHIHHYYHHQYHHYGLPIPHLNQNYCFQHGVGGPPPHQHMGSHPQHCPPSMCIQPDVAHYMGLPPRPPYGQLPMAAYPLLPGTYPQGVVDLPWQHDPAERPFGFPPIGCIAASPPAILPQPPHAVAPVPTTPMPSGPPPGVDGSGVPTTVPPPPPSMPPPPPPGHPGAPALTSGAASTSPATIASTAPAVTAAAAAATAAASAPAKGKDKKSSSEGRAAKLRRNKWINRQVTRSADAGNIHKLLQTVEFHINEMNGINLATALHRVTKLAVGGTSGLTVQQLLKHHCFLLLRSTVVRQIDQHKTLMAEHAALGTPNDKMPQPLFEVQCMSIVCWACATLRLHEEDLMATIADVVIHRLDELKPFELSNMVWAYAKLSVGTPMLFSAVSERMFRREEGEFGVQCLSMIAWSFATAKKKDNPLFLSIAHEMTSIASMTKSQEIANTLWAYAKNRCAEVTLFNSLADIAIENNMLWTFKPQELSNTLWSFATIGHQHPALFKAAVAVATSKRYQLSPQNIANILWAYAKLQACRRSGLFPALLGVSVGMMPKHKPQEISAIVWAAAKESYPDCRRFFGATAQTCTQRLHEFPPQALANMMEAFAVIEADAPSFSEAMACESVGRLHQFEPTALANLFRGAVLVARRSRNNVPPSASGAAGSFAGDSTVASAAAGASAASAVAAASSMATSATAGNPAGSASSVGATPKGTKTEKQVQVLAAIGAHIVKRLDEMQATDLLHIEHSMQLLGPTLRQQTGGLDRMPVRRPGASGADRWKQRGGTSSTSLGDIAAGAAVTAAVEGCAAPAFTAGKYGADDGGSFGDGYASLRWQGLDDVGAAQLRSGGNPGDESGAIWDENVPVGAYMLGDFLAPDPEEQEIDDDAGGALSNTRPGDDEDRSLAGSSGSPFVRPAGPGSTCSPTEDSGAWDPWKDGSASLLALPSGDVPPTRSTLPISGAPAPTVQLTNQAPSPAAEPTFAGAVEPPKADCLEVEPAAAPN